MNVSILLNQKIDEISPTLLVVDAHKIHISPSPIFNIANPLWPQANTHYTHTIFLEKKRKTERERERVCVVGHVFVILKIAQKPHLI